MPEDTPYDPYIPSGSGSTPNPQANTRSPQQGPDAYANLQQEVQDATGVMKKNVERLYERGDNLDTLGQKTDTLANQSALFRTGASRVRKQMWWKDVKMRICLIVGVIILILIIVLPVVLTVGKN